MLKNFMVLSLTTALGACSTLGIKNVADFKLDDADFIEAIYSPSEVNVETPPLERIEPLALPGQLKPIQSRKVAAIPKLRPDLDSDLKTYAAIYEQTYGEKASVPALIPFMLRALIASDSGFKKAVRASQSS